MAVVPDQFATPQGGLRQAAPLESDQALMDPARATIDTINDEQAPIDPIRKATQKMAMDREALNLQIDKLSKSLSQRQNLPFNPMYLDIARAAATPASTGSAIQALGNIGGAYGDSYLKENQRQIDIGKDQMELLKQKQALSQIDLERELRTSYLKGPQPTMPAGPPAAGSTSPAPAMAGGVPTASSPPQANQPNRMRRITDADIYQLEGAFPKLAEELKGLSQIQQKAIMVTTEGIFDSMSGTYLEKFQTNIERPMRVLGKQTMTKDQSAKYDQMMAALEQRNASESEKDQAVARFAANAGIGGVRITDGQITGFQSTAQKELREDADKKNQENRIEENKASRTRVYDAGTRAQATKQAAITTYSLATNKETMGAFGVLTKPGVLNAIAVAVSQFISRGSFGEAGLEQAVRLAGGTEKEIQAASYVVSLQGQLQLMAAQDYLKGQGAVSDAERRLIANLVGNLSDTPKSVAMKAKVIEARANYDQLVADAFYKYEKENPSGSVQDFYRKEGGEFKKLFGEYDQHMSGLYSHYFGVSKPAATPNSPASAPSAKPPNAPATRGPLEQRLLDKKKAAS